MMRLRAATGERPHTAMKAKRGQNEEMQRKKNLLLSYTSQEEDRHLYLKKGLNI